MNKSQTLLISHDGTKKLNEGDMVICIQGNKEGETIMVNLDWSFSLDMTPTEIKSMLGGFLGNIEDIFGEKMVTEAVMHYAEDKGHLVKTPQGMTLHLKSKGLDFNKFREE